jgi:hypothetical protein
VTESTPGKPTSDETLHSHEVEEYQGGDIQSRHGYIPAWLLVVYAVLLLWGLLYTYDYWGGLGPGRL